MDEIPISRRGTVQSLAKSSEEDIEYLRHRLQTYSVQDGGGLSASTSELPTGGKQPGRFGKLFRRGHASGPAVEKRDKEDKAKEKEKEKERTELLQKKAKSIYDAEGKADDMKYDLIDALCKHIETNGALGFCFDLLCN